MTGLLNLMLPEVPDPVEARARELMALAERIESEDVGSSRLDEEVWNAFNPGRRIEDTNAENAPPDAIYWFDLPNYTTSIDAALMLVPPHAWVQIKHRRGDDNSKQLIAGFETGSVPYWSAGLARTFPLCVVSAALRHLAATLRPERRDG
jgi:hypothetical protein